MAEIITFNACDHANDWLEAHSVPFRGRTPAELEYFTRTHAINRLISRYAQIVVENTPKLSGAQWRLLMNTVEPQGAVSTIAEMHPDLSQVQVLCVLDVLERAWTIRQKVSEKSQKVSQEK